MNVQEILDLMGLMSVGEDPSSPADQAIFLKYLRLAHQELFRLTAHINADLLTSETLQNDVGSNFVTLSQSPYLITKVYIPNYYAPLTQLTFDTYVEQKFLNTNTSGTPHYFSTQKGVVYLYPTTDNQQYEVNVFYIPLVTLTRETSEEDIACPVAYHDVLLNGALTYLFKDESGFKSTSQEQDAKALWMMGKQDLISFLSYQSCGSMSTYSNV